MSTPSGYRSKGHGDDRKVYPIFDPTQNVGKPLKGSKYVDDSRQQLYEQHMERDGATVTIPARKVHLKVVNVDTKDLVPSDPEQQNLNHRAEHFVEMQRQGRTIPPILVHKLPSGKYEVIDGHARLEAYRRMGVKRIPVVENSVSEVLGRIAGGVTHAATSVVSGAVRGYRQGREEAKGERYKMLKNLSHSKNPVVRARARAKIKKEFPDASSAE